jgi:hypothetical protein
VVDVGGSRVLLTRGRGFLGPRIATTLEERGAKPIVVRSADYDLTDPRRVRAAPKDGGIKMAAISGGDD